MELQQLIDDVREQLLTAAENSGDESRAVAERMTATIDSALRLALLEAVSAAAAEITVDLAPGCVDVLLRGRDPEFAVTLPPQDPPQAPIAPLAPPPVADAEDGGTARITLRLSDQLKTRVEQAAGKEGLSVNAWLIRALSAATDGGHQHSPPPPYKGQAFTGWVR